MKRLKMLLLTLASGFVLASCSSTTEASVESKASLEPNQQESSASSSKNEEVTETDLLGRSVTYKKNAVDKVVCIGGGALRLYTYVVGANNLVGVEDIDRSEGGNFAGIAVPYKDANLSYFSTLPSCGKGGPQGQTPEQEAIISCKPNVVISMLTDAKAANDLQDRLGVPVFCLSYGKQQVFNDNLLNSIKLLGRVFNKDARATELVDYINGVKTDLQNKTKDITNKPSVYLGCLGNYGVQDIYSSSAKYSLFEVANINNVLDSANPNGGYVTVDKEALFTYNPDKIIIDAAGLSKFAVTYKQNKADFDSLKAFKNGEVYLQMAYNAYYTNIEIALIDAYYSAVVVYGLDIDIEAKANEVLTKFIGSSYTYENVKSMKKSYGGFQKLTIEKIEGLA